MERAIQSGKPPIPPAGGKQGHMTPPPTIIGEAERFRVGPESWVQVHFQGPVDQRAIKKLLRPYQENIDLYPDETGQEGRDGAEE